MVYHGFERYLMRLETALLILNELSLLAQVLFNWKQWKALENRRLICPSPMTAEFDHFHLGDKELNSTK